MDTIALVDLDIDEGLNLLNRLQEQFPIDAACWVKLSDEDRWSLNITTPLVDEKGTTAGYRIVNDTIRAMNIYDIFDSRVRLLGTTNQTARVLRELQNGRPGFRSDIPLGLAFADRVYIYPPPGQKPVTLYGMIFRGAPVGGLHLSFEPHSENKKYTISDGMGTKTYPAETGKNWVVVVPVGAKLEEDERGHKSLGWDLHGNRIRSDAQTVFSLANLGLHGFRVLKRPSDTEPETA